MKHFTRAELEKRPLAGAMMGTRSPALMSPHYLMWHAVPVDFPDGETMCGRTKTEDPEGDFHAKDFNNAAGGVPRCEECVEMLAYGQTEGLGAAEPR
jgi:hypothetical protein